MLFSDQRLVMCLIQSGLVCICAPTYWNWNFLLAVISLFEARKRGLFVATEPWETFTPLPPLPSPAVYVTALACYGVDMSKEKSLQVDYYSLRHCFYTT